jgi:hypothetical protein
MMLNFILFSHLAALLFEFLAIAVPRCMREVPKD